MIAQLNIGKNGEDINHFWLIKFGCLNLREKGSTVFVFSSLCGKCLELFRKSFSTISNTLSNLKLLPNLDTAVGLVVVTIVASGRSFPYAILD